MFYWFNLFIGRCCGRALKDKTMKYTSLSPLEWVTIRSGPMRSKGAPQGMCRKQGPLPGSFLMHSAPVVCSVVVPAFRRVYSHPGLGLLPAGVSPWHPQWAAPPMGSQLVCPFLGSSPFFILSALIPY